MNNHRCIYSIKRFLKSRDCSGLVFILLKVKCQFLVFIIKINCRQHCLLNVSIFLLPSAIIKRAGLDEGFMEQDNLLMIDKVYSASC